MDTNHRQRHGLPGREDIREGGDEGLDVFWQVVEGEGEDARESGAITVLDPGGHRQKQQQLLMVGNGGGTPVSLVGQGTDVLVVDPGELQVDAAGRRCRNSMERRRDRCSSRGELSQASQREARKGDGTPEL